MTADYDALAKDDLSRVMAMLGHLDAAMATAGSSMGMAGREADSRAMSAMRAVVCDLAASVSGMLGEREDAL